MGVKVMKRLGKKIALELNETLTAYACNPCTCGCLKPNDASSDYGDDKGGENAK